MTSIFTLEVIVKWIAWGLLMNGKKSYFRSSWNWLDFGIVIFSLLSIFGSKQFKLFKVLRLLRVLRPLRVINRNEGLKLAVQTLFKAVPQFINLGIILGVFFLLVSIFCMTFLKGLLVNCITKGTTGVSLTPDNMYDCYNQGATWASYPYHFNNNGRGMMTLFQISIGNRVSVILASLDHRKSPILTPQPNFSIEWGVILILITVFFGFFLVNLFVGVVVSTFNQQKEKNGNDFLLTPKQQEWLNIKKFCLTSRPLVLQLDPAENPHLLRKICFQIQKSNSFEGFILALILLNTLVLAMKSTSNSIIFESNLSRLNDMFSYLFLAEAILKITALRKRYFQENWNVFDLAIVISSLLGQVIDFVIGSNFSQNATLIRTLRVVRVLRLIKRAKLLKVVIDTIINTLPSIANVGSLLFLILYIYSILGMQLFSLISLKEYLHDKANF